MDRCACAFALWLLALGCSGQVEATATSQASVVQGSDDRHEYFEAHEEPTRARLLESAVALVPDSRIVRLADGTVRVDAPSLGETERLCPGEAFADQPSAAFCSAVLLDGDLLLTAGHCARVLAPGDFSAVFGYFYQAPGELALTERDVVPVVAIAAEALSAASEVPRYDFAWLRLARRMGPPRAPAPLYVRDPVLAAGEPLVVLSAVGGVPLKVDSGAVVRDARPSALDYFLADTDTSHGSSGGGAFDARGTLLGVLARGGADFVSTPDACWTTRFVADGAATEEQFSYAHTALRALCSADPGSSSLCRAECENPCSALPETSDFPAAGASCSVSTPHTPRAAHHFCLAALIVVAFAARRLSAARTGCRGWRSRPHVTCSRPYRARSRRRRPPLGNGSLRPRSSPRSPPSENAS